MNTGPLPSTPSPPPTTLLHLLWLASPALPVGGFSYSEGLESAIDAGAVHDEPSTQAWLLDQMHLGLGRSELPLLAQATGAWVAHERQAYAPMLAILSSRHESQYSRLFRS